MLIASKIIHASIAFVDDTQNVLADSLGGIGRSSEIINLEVAA
jgi:hypothetical protein